jgi:hypothetical protein
MEAGGIPEVEKRKKEGKSSQFIRNGVEDHT